MELNGVPMYKSIVLGSFSRTPLAILVESKLYTALTMKLPSLSPVHLIVPSDLYVQLPLVSPMPKLRPTATASIGCLGDGGGYMRIGSLNRSRYSSQLMENHRALSIQSRRRCKKSSANMFFICFFQIRGYPAACSGRRYRTNRYR